MEGHDDVGEVENGGMERDPMEVSYGVEKDPMRGILWSGEGSYEMYPM